jgi:predicted PurR-regulated permease PerM
MNATLPSRPSVQPAAVPKLHSRSRSPLPVKPRQQYRAIVIETSAKIAVNLVAAGIAIATLTHLIPYAMTQADRLQELQAEVKRTNNRVQQLRNSLSYYFDPQQAQNVMEAVGHRMNPQEYRVITTPSNAKGQQ